MSAEQEPAAAKAVAGVLSEQTVVQSAVEAAGKMHQFTEVLLGEASETSELPEGFRFHWMSEIPVWKATLAGLSEAEQAEVIRRACSEDQSETEANTRHMVQFKMLSTASDDVLIACRAALLTIWQVSPHR